MPASIFATAYDQYAVRAFEVNAVDYLLKPFSEARFEQALQRAEQRLGEQRPVAAGVLAAAARPAGSFAARLVIKDGARIELLPVGDLDYARAQGDYVELVSGRRSWLKEQTLQDSRGGARPRPLRSPASLVHHPGRAAPPDRADEQGLEGRGADHWSTDPDQPDRPGAAPLVACAGEPLSAFLPPPLDAQDPRSFAYLTLTRRVPRVVADVLEAVALSAPRPRPAGEGGGAPTRADGPPAASAARGRSALGGVLRRARGKAPRALPFFEWEAYLYAWLLVETGHYDTGLDPFAAAKRQDFAASLPNLEEASRTALEADVQHALRGALQRSLLANLADASNPQIQAGNAAATPILHADPWEDVEEPLLAGPEVLILADNAMSELWYDLLLARALARAAPATRVDLVLKRHPMFVSDATPPDVAALWELVDGAPGAEGLGRAAADVRSLIAAAASGCGRGPSSTRPGASPRRASRRSSARTRPS